MHLYEFWFTVDNDVDKSYRVLFQSKQLLSTVLVITNAESYDKIRADVAKEIGVNDFKKLKLTLVRKIREYKNKGF